MKRQLKYLSSNHPAIKISVYFPPLLPQWTTILVSITSSSLLKIQMHHFRTIHASHNGFWMLIQRPYLRSPHWRPPFVLTLLNCWFVGLHKLKGRAVEILKRCLRVPEGRSTLRFEHGIWCMLELFCSFGKTMDNSCYVIREMLSGRNTNVTQRKPLFIS